MIKKIIDGIGIDFGTYYTKIAIIENGINAKLLPKVGIKKYNPNVDNIFLVDGIIPSFLQGENIGKTALKNWKKGEKVHSKFKLGLGVNKKDASNEITKKFLTLLYQQVIQPLENDYEIKDYRITFPNQWDEKRTETLLKTFKESGFKIGADNKKLLTPEPYASAIYYADLLKNIEKDCYFLIIDVGAGTTDISLVKYDFRNRELIVDEEKGCRKGFEIAGCHIDESIAQELTNNKDISYHNTQYASFISEVEKAKIQLTKVEMDSYKFEHNDKLYTVDKKLIRKACTTFSKELEIYLTEISEIIKKEAIHIDYILTAGGSGELFLVKEAIKKVFNRDADNHKIREKRTIIETDDSIPLGSAMEAAKKYSYKDIVNHPICLAILVGVAKHQFGNGLLYDKNDKKLIKYAFYGENVLIELIKKGTRTPTETIYTSKIFYSDKTNFKIYSGGATPKVKIMTLKNEIKENGIELDDSDILVKEQVKLISKDPKHDFLGKVLSFEVNEDENRKVNIEVVIHQDSGEKFKAFSTSLNELDKELAYDE